MHRHVRRLRPRPPRRPAPTWFISVTSTTTPLSQMEAPVESCPPARTHSGRRRAAAQRTAAATSASLAAYTIRAGSRLLYIAFRISLKSRASSYCRRGRSAGRVGRGGATATRRRGGGGSAGRRSACTSHPHLRLAQQHGAAAQAVHELRQLILGGVELLVEGGAGGEGRRQQAAPRRRRHPCSGAAWGANTRRDRRESPFLGCSACSQSGRGKGARASGGGGRGATAGRALTVIEPWRQPERLGCRDQRGERQQAAEGHNPHRRP